MIEELDMCKADALIINYYLVRSPFHRLPPFFPLLSLTTIITTAFEYASQLITLTSSINIVLALFEFLISSWFLFLSVSYHVSLCEFPIWHHIPWVEDVGGNNSNTLGAHPQYSYPTNTHHHHHFLPISKYICCYLWSTIFFNQQEHHIYINNH